MGTWIDLNNIFDNRQGFGTQLNIEECLHEETDVLISNDLYQQLIGTLNKYYDDTDKIVVDLNNNVNYVKDELEKTNEKVLLNRTSINNILGELITIRGNIQTNLTNIEKNKNDILELDELISQLNVTINNVDNKYKIYRDNITIVSNDNELRNALENNIKIIFIKATEVFNPTEAYEIPANTRIIGIEYPTFNCDYSASLNNMFRNKLDGTEGEYNGSGNIIIEGLNFIGNDTTKAITVLAFAHSDYVKIKNCKFDGFNNWHNIEINGCRNVLIEDCVFTNFGQGSSNPTEVIQIDLPLNETTYPWTCKYDKTVCTNITIENNTFFNIATSTGAIGTHTYVQGYKHENIRIENNRLYNVDNFLYLLACKGLRVLRNYGEQVFNFMYIGGIENNVFSNCQVIGNEIYFKQSYKVKPPEPSGYAGKFIYPILNSSATSTLDSNIVISDNIVVGCIDHAITTACNSVFISNNYVSNCGKHAIYIWGGNKVVIQGNIVHQVSSLNIMLGGNSNITTERCICTNNVGSIGTGVGYTSSNCLESNNITN